MSDPHGAIFGSEAQGLSEIQRHNLPEALLTIKTSLAKTPNNAYLNYLTAEILKEQGTAPGSSEAMQGLADAKHAVTFDSGLLRERNLPGRFAFAAEGLPLALGASRATLKQDPINEESLFRRILILHTAPNR